jgi:hypothetical protein
MHVLLQNIVRSVVNTYRPVPACSVPPFNSIVLNWLSGQPIPEGTICMRMLTMNEMELAWKLSDENIIDAMIRVILASLCDHTGNPLYTSPEKPLDFPAEDITKLKEHLSTSLARHIYDCIREFSGWGKYGKLEEDPVTVTAKN